MNRRSHLTVVPRDASPEEAAAAVAAIEQFLRDTTPAPAPPATPAISAWKRAALSEGIACAQEFPPPVTKSL